MIHRKNLGLLFVWGAGCGHCGGDEEVLGSKSGEARAMYLGLEFWWAPSLFHVEQFWEPGSKWEMFHVEQGPKMPKLGFDSKRNTWL